MATEPFPDIDPSHAPGTPSDGFSATSATSAGTRQRKSSNLRADPRGDTSGPALATLYDQSPSSTSNVKPRIQFSCPYDYLFLADCLFVYVANNSQNQP
jgi:hypothetical protein